MPRKHTLEKTRNIEIMAHIDASKEDGDRAHRPPGDCKTREEVVPLVEANDGRLWPMAPYGRRRS